MAWLGCEASQGTRMVLANTLPSMMRLAVRTNPALVTVTSEPSWSTLAVTARLPRRDRHEHERSQGYPGTGAIPTAVAACIDGTVVNRVCSPREGDRVVIGRPSGVVHADSAIKVDPTHGARPSWVRLRHRSLPNPNW